MKKFVVGGIGILAGLYLLNPGFGLFEFIPDNIPLAGNLDEGTAAFLILSALAYFGLDLRDVFGGWWKPKK
jgi:hypothetical protein